MKIIPIRVDRSDPAETAAEALLASTPDQDLIGVINGQARQYWADEISPLMEMVETAGDLVRTGTP